MYSIVKGIPKPANLPEKVGSTKYPLAEMEVGDSFVVPYTEMNEGEKPEKFRSRIYQSARNYALRDYNQRRTVWEQTESEADAPEPQKKEFTAALMEKDDETPEKRWAQGDVVVWRDK